MKKQIIHFLLAISVLSFACGTVAFAHITDPNQDVGAVPSSRLYVLKEFGRKIKMFFTFGQTAKLELQFKVLNEKSNEFQMVNLVDPENESALDKALKNYTDARERLRAKFESLKTTSKNPNIDALLEKFNAHIETHADVFESKEKDVAKKEVVKSAPMQVTVEINSGGVFVPKQVTIKKGGAVTWVNKGSKSVWPASAFHPTHQVYPEFDSLKGIKANESYSFVFDRIGSWKYHDHLNASASGVIDVVE